MIPRHLYSVYIDHNGGQDRWETNSQTSFNFHAIQHPPRDGTAHSAGALWPLGSLRFSRLTSGFILIITLDFNTITANSTIIIITIVIIIGMQTLSHIWTWFHFIYLLFLPWASKCKVLYDIYKERQVENAEEGLKENQNWKDKIGCFKRHWTFDFSTPFQLLLFQDSDILWIPDHLWTQATVEKVSAGSRCPDLSFSSLYPNQAPLFLLVPKKLSSWNSFLSFWPKFACVARNRDAATASWRGGVMKTNGL